jgi:hypothetical protein
MRRMLRRIKRAPILHARSRHAPVTHRAVGDGCSCCARRDQRVRRLQDAPARNSGKLGDGRDVFSRIARKSVSSPRVVPTAKRQGFRSFRGFGGFGGFKEAMFQRFQRTEVSKLQGFKEANVSEVSKVSEVSEDKSWDALHLSVPLSAQVMAACLPYRARRV